MRVLVVGDGMTDVDVHGRCSRFAAECPALPVFEETHRETRPGGAGAVAEMGRAWGAEVELLTGPHLSLKTRAWVGDRLVFRHDRDADRPTAAEVAALADAVGRAVPLADAVLVADHGKGACQYAVVRAAITRASALGIPCLVDPAWGVDWRTYRGATCIKCNRREWDHVHAMNAGRSAGWWEEYTANVIVTDGAAGMTHFPRRAAAVDYPARPSRAVDVTGCGDVVLAALGVRLAAGEGWPAAIRFAAVAAGLKVERRGAVGVPLAEVLADPAR